MTGASRGYAFVEYETEKEMRRAYEVQCASSSFFFGLLLWSVKLFEIHVVYGFTGCSSFIH